MRERLQWAVVLGVLTAAGAAQAAGFAVSTHGARATGMATSVVAGIDDASSAFFNPAGLTLLEGLEVQLGDTLIVPGFEVTTRFPEPLPNSATQVETVPVPPPHFYAGYKFDDNLAFGLGFFIPFGLALHWPDDWAGSQIITDASFNAFYLNPEIAYRLGRVRVGAGLQLVRGDVTLERRARLPLPGAPAPVEATSKLEGDAWGVGANLGVQVDVIPDLLVFGAHYRSAVRLDIKGNADFGGLPAPFDTALDQAVDTRITLPNVVYLGLGSKPLDKLWVEFNTVYYGWQSFRELRINFANPGFPPTVLPKRWKHVWNFHLGGEYEVTDAIAVRAGVEYDPTPSPDETVTPDIPDSDRVNLAAGLGYQSGKLGVDLGYQYIIVTSNDTAGTNPFPATYGGNVHLVGVTLGYGK